MLMDGSCKDSMLSTSDFEDPVECYRVAGTKLSG